MRGLGASGASLDEDTFLVGVGGVVKGAPTAQYLSDDITGSVPISIRTINGFD